MPDPHDEAWRPIPGHPDYELSNHGRVRSWRRWEGCRDRPPRLLKIYERSGRRLVALAGRNYHDIDALLREIWGLDVAILPRHPAPSWRRLMLSAREHRLLCHLLELADRFDSADGGPASKLLKRVQTARTVAWDDPILPEELEELEEDPCVG